MNDRVNYNYLVVNKQDRYDCGCSGEIDGLSDTAEIVNMIVTRN